MRYSLRQLEVFLATAAQENVTRAAEGLAMSQSAASGALKELEDQFGVKLFDRVGKRLQLSELGRQLRPQAETLLAQARAFEQALAGEDAMAAHPRPMNLFRNLKAKVAAIPMVLTVLFVFVGGTIWTGVYSFTNSKLLPRLSLVGLDHVERLWDNTRWPISIPNPVS